MVIYLAAVQWAVTKTILIYCFLLIYVAQFVLTEWMEVSGAFCGWPSGSRYACACARQRCMLVLLYNIDLVRKLFHELLPTYAYANMSHYLSTPRQ